jgi:hypothetical protein
LFYIYFSLVTKKGYPKKFIDKKGYSVYKSLRIPAIRYTYKIIIYSGKDSNLSLQIDFPAAGKVVMKLIDGNEGRI